MSYFPETNIILYFELSYGLKFGSLYMLLLKNIFIYCYHIFLNIAVEKVFCYMGNTFLIFKKDIYINKRYLLFRKLLMIFFFCGLSDFLY